jgi:hypothetical protein
VIGGTELLPEGRMLAMIALDGKEIDVGSFSLVI